MIKLNQFNDFFLIRKESKNGRFQSFVRENWNEPWRKDVQDNCPDFNGLRVR